MSVLDWLVNNCENYQVLKYLMVTEKKIKQYRNIVVAVSGGSDSDIMIDMFNTFDTDKKVKYVFFDTGIEYKATKEHLDYLEKKYDITIHREKALKSIPTCCKEYGQPFLNKLVSEYISRLQRHDFQWEDEDFETLYKKYPKCKIALMWWCNSNEGNSFYNIKRNKWLKEFIINNPPQFKISNKCCDYAKKNVAKKYDKLNNTDLKVVGVRHQEGGARAAIYKNCFDKNDEGFDNYRPLFFFSDDDKKYYKEFCDVTYSDCYEVWGMKRTRCVGCPYGRKLDEELELCKKYEPNLYKAVNNIFKDAYEYTAKFKEFKKSQTERG